MTRDEETKDRSQPQEETATNKEAASNRTDDDDQRSYPGKLDKVEGDMNNGVIGGGIEKQDEQNQ